MNWKNRYRDFEVGNRVRIINPLNNPEEEEDQPDYEMGDIVTLKRAHSTSQTRGILWELEEYEVAAYESEFERIL